MRRIGVSVLLCCLPALDQTPPVPGAVLVAGSPPAQLRTLDIPIRAFSIALAPDGSLVAAEFEHVWRIPLDGSLSEIAGPWNPARVLINSIAVDNSGNLYVAEAYQHVIWKIDPQGRAVAVAGQGMNPPAGSGPVAANSVAAPALFLVVDSRQNVYYSSGFRIWKITPDGMLSAFAGTGVQGQPQPAADPVPALQYPFIYTGRMALDGADNIYVADGSRVLQISQNGLLHRIPLRGLPDGANVEAVATDAAGNLVISLARTGYAGQVARVGSDGAVRIIAGTGESGLHDGCTPDAPGVPLAINATLGDSVALAMDGSGNIYVSDPPNTRVRVISPDGLIHTVAGGPGGAFAGDGQAATQALLAHPAGLAFDSVGNLYFADRYNNRVRRVDLSGRIDTMVGGGAAAGQDPACVSYSGLQLSQPSAVAADPDDNIYIADIGNNRIVKLATDGTLTVVADKLDTPTGLAFGFGNLYIAEKGDIRYLNADGVMQTFYPEYLPWGVAVDAAGNLYAGNLEISNGGRVYTLPFQLTTALATGPQGEVYGSDASHRIVRLDQDCSETPIYTAGALLEGIAVAPNGDLIVSDSTANLIWRIPATPSSGVPSPTLSPVSVVNGASLTPRTIYVNKPNPWGGTIVVPEPANEAVAPGETVRISGVCLAPLSFQQGSIANGSVSPSIGDTQVLFDGVAAPLLSASANQIVAVVPYETAGKSSSTLEVRYKGQKAAVKLDTSAASIGIFPVPGFTVTRGAAASLLITGEGQANPPGVTGQVSDGSPRQPVGQVQVRVQGLPAELISVAPDPGAIGSTRVSFRVPDGAAPGSGTVTISVGQSTASVSAVVL